MAVETATYISQLDSSLPTGGSPKSEGDDHLRLLKAVIKAQFPNFGTAAVNTTVAELNYMVGVTSGVQTQLNTLTSTKAAKAGDTYTGTHDFTGATALIAPSPATGDNSSKVPTTAWVVSLALAGTLPGQAGKAGRFVQTDGTTPTWQTMYGPASVITGNTTAVVGRAYVLNAALTLTLPASPNADDLVHVIDISNTSSCVIGRNGSNIMGLAEDFNLDNSYSSLTFVYVDATRGWLMFP